MRCEDRASFDRQIVVVLAPHVENNYFFFHIEELGILIFKKS